MKYQVPQFIEVEDKIFGPLTLKQFVYLAGGAGLSLIFYAILPNFLPTFIVLIPIAAVMGFTLTLAFYKINNKPFINVLEAAFKYLYTPKLYIWKKESKPITPEEKQQEPESSSAFIPSLSNSKLKDLTWSLDVREANKSVNQKDDAPM